MRFLGMLSVLLTSLGCYSFPKYRSELLNYPGLKSNLTDDLEVYEIKEHSIQVALKFEVKKLYLKITNNSDELLKFLPLDLNLGTTDNRCSIKEIYENSKSGKKVNFETNFEIAKEKTATFYYKFDCEKEPEAFLTINGLTKKDKRLTLNFKFLKN